MVEEHRIDDLARIAGTTVRNVRAYQDRGLLPPPRRQGRVGFYSEAHLARLRLIGQMLERGYSLANIGELLGAWETGQNVGELLGLEAALSAPWSDETPTVVSVEELAAMFGGPTADAAGVLGAASEAVRAGLLEPQEDGFLVKRPRLLRIGAELLAAGIPLDAVMRLAEDLYEDVDVIARRFVDLVTMHVFDPVGEPIPAAEVPRLAEIVRRLRPLAQESVDTVLADAMERHVRDELRERLSRILRHR
ncbi:MAG: MerR family transcriptional regulator [Acidimicrobiales bacterium]